MDWNRILVKTIRTMAQALVGVIPTSGYFWGWDWKPIASTTVVAGLTCLLMAIADSDNMPIEEEELQYDELVEEDE